MTDTPKTEISCETLAHANDLIEALDHEGLSVGVVARFLQAYDARKCCTPKAENVPAMNTDRELWRARPGDYYSDSIHVTVDGGIGMNVGGFVIVLPLELWHAAAKKELAKATLAPAPEVPAPSFVNVVRHIMSCGVEESTAKRALLRLQNEGIVRFTSNWTVEVPAQPEQEQAVREWHRLNGEIGWTDRQVAACVAARVQEATKPLERELQHCKDELAMRKDDDLAVAKAEAGLAQLREALMEVDDYLGRAVASHEKLTGLQSRVKLALSGAPSTPTTGTARQSNG